MINHAKSYALCAVRQVVCYGRRLKHADARSVLCVCEQQFVTVGRDEYSLHVSKTSTVIPVRGVYSYTCQEPLTTFKEENGCVAANSGQR